MKTDRQMPQRIVVTDDAIESALAQLCVTLRQAVLKHGNLSFISAHEVMGTIQEEVRECELACHQNDLIEFSKELLDVATVCVFAHASRLQFNRKEAEEKEVWRKVTSE